MHNKTKIVVLHMKELIYTAIFAALAILFVVLLIVMFGKKDSDEAMETMAQATYVPGVYTTSLTLNNSVVNVEVVVDENHINAVRLVNINETITTMFPLMEPSFDSIAGQIYEGVDLANITYDEESRYTSQALIKAIETALNKASVANISENDL
ncbi:MAG: hypothetical protein IJZ44_06580 [Lachnospiraceae bacterium]|nr:hypothetical protein [Lachnospiraceae bacterium]